MGGLEEHELSGEDFWTCPKCLAYTTNSKKRERNGVEVNHRKPAWEYRCKVCEELGKDGNEPAPTRKDDWDNKQFIEPLGMGKVLCLEKYNWKGNKERFFRFERDCHDKRHGKLH